MKEFNVLQGTESLRVALSGEIDAENADEFFGAFEEAYAPAPRDVEFVCEGLEFIDSTALGTFVKISKRVKADGHGLKLKGLMPRLKKLFVICALDRVMEIEA